MSRLQYAAQTIKKLSRSLRCSQVPLKLDLRAIKSSISLLLTSCQWTLTRSSKLISSFCEKAVAAACCRNSVLIKRANSTFHYTASNSVGSPPGRIEAALGYPTKDWLCAHNYKILVVCLSRVVYVSSADNISMACMGNFCARSRHT